MAAVEAQTARNDTRTCLPNGNFALMASPKKKRTVSTTHKEAMAAGRESARAVNAYLTALDSNKPKRGRKVSVSTLEARLTDARAKADAAVGTSKLLALQEITDLQGRIKEASAPDTVDLTALEKAFIKSAKPYGESKGVAYGTWRSAGVSADVLKEGGHRPHPLVARNLPAQEVARRLLLRLAEVLSKSDSGILSNVTRVVVASRRRGGSEGVTLGARCDVTQR
jgi:hypothetical protein